MSLLNRRGPLLLSVILAAGAIAACQGTAPTTANRFATLDTTVPSGYPIAIPSSLLGIDPNHPPSAMPAGWPPSSLPVDGAGNYTGGIPSSYPTAVPSGAPSYNPSDVDLTKIGPSAWMGGNGVKQVPSGVPSSIASQLPAGYQNLAGLVAAPSGPADPNAIGGYTNGLSGPGGLFGPPTSGDVVQPDGGGWMTNTYPTTTNQTSDQNSSGWSGQTGNIGGSNPWTGGYFST